MQSGIVSAKKYVVNSYMRMENGYQKITIFVNAYT